MKAMKKLLSLCLALCLVLGLATPAFAAEEAEMLELAFDDAYVNAYANITLDCGATKSYTAYINGEMVFTMYADAVSVVYNGNTYESVDGMLSFPVAGTRWEPCQFEITNGSETETEYEITFAPPAGTQMNPELVYDPTELTASLKEGNNQGYFYKFYNRMATGELAISVASATEGVGYDVTLMNNTTYEQKSLAEDGVDGVVSIPIAPRDEIIIIVAAMPDTSWNYPALDITLKGEIIYPVGTQMNPELVYDPTEIVCDIAEGNDQGYYYSFYNRAANGALSFTASCEDEGIEYNVILTNMNTYEMAWLSESEDGTVSVNIAPGDQVIIQVAVSPDAEWNYPAAKVTLNGEIVYPEGTQMNPKLVFDPTELTASLAEGNDQGYYFKFYNRMVTGKLAFSVASATEGVEYGLTLMNNTSYVQKTLAEDGVDGVVTMDIAPGDEIMIIVAALPDANWNIPALDITLKGEIIYPLGSNENPAVLALGQKNIASVEAGDNDGYFFTWTATEDGELNITVESESGWSYVVNNLTAYSYGEIKTSDVASNKQTVKVSKGDLIQVNVNTYNPADPWNSPAGNVTVSIEMAKSVVFEDVPAGAYYKDAVDWALKAGITTGQSETKFAPFELAQRCQVVTFIWRAAGCPEPTSQENPFTDVKPGDYFYKAVLWAVEEGITTGTGEGTFSPFNECERCQVVTFLWRAAGKPATGSNDNPFVDVSTDNYFYEAVLWAVEEGITTGADATHFAPFNKCERCQIVTFLYRAQ